MDRRDIDQFVESLIYHFDTIRCLQDYGRLRETVPIMQRILEHIQAFRQAVQGQDDLKGIFPESFWDQGLRGTVKREDVRHKIVDFSGRGDLMTEKDLEEIDYVYFIGELRRWTYQNIYQIRQRTKSPQQKKMETILTVLCVCVATLSLALFLVLNATSRNWGLKGDFYDGRDLGKWISAWPSKSIDFDYYLQMNPLLRHEENYSAHFTGYVLAPKEGNYAFSVVVDDGTRLFIDDKPLIDAWYDSDSVEFSKEIFLTKGTHKIRLDYYNHLWGIKLRLFWVPPGGKKVLIPAYYLRQEAS